MKDKIMNMPAWKVIVIIFMMIFGIVVIAETIIVHSAFHLFDRAIMSFEKMDTEDKKDAYKMELDDVFNKKVDTKKEEQEKKEYAAKLKQIIQDENCNKYQQYIHDKESLKKHPNQEYVINSFDRMSLFQDKKYLNNEIKNHRFDAESCKQKLKYRVESSL